MITIRLLLWDRWNITHIARHGVIRREVEEVCHGHPVAEEGYGGRIRLIGVTHEGKFLAVLLEPEGDDLYSVVTARPASRKERRRYREAQGG